MQGSCKLGEETESHACESLPSIRLSRYTIGAERLGAEESLHDNGHTGRQGSKGMATDVQVTSATKDSAIAGCKRTDHSRNL